MQEQTTKPNETATEQQAVELEAMNGDDATAQANEAPEAQPGEAEAEKEDEALEAALAKQEEYLNMAQRVQADFDNYRRRNQNLRKEAFDDGTRAFAITLLPVLDNMERAIAAARNSSDSSLLEGVEMVYRQLLDAFNKRGITEIECLHQRFDPNLQNAVMQASPEDGEPGTVCEILQKGYQMESVVLRHAMVKVVPEA